MGTVYEKCFSSPEKTALYIKENCVRDCYECSWPVTIPCEMKFACQCSIEELIEWLTETDIQMIKYIYQASNHSPMWSISYEVEWVKSIRMLKVYATMYSEEIDNKRHAAYFEAMGKTPFAVAHSVQSFADDNGVTFTTEDFNQVEWEMSRYF